MSQSRRALKKSLRTDFNPSARLRLIRAVHGVERMKNVPALLRGATLDRPVFIIGAPRSGTSLLYAILRQSSRLKHYPGESHEIWEADYHPALRGWDSNALSAEDLTDDAAARIRRSFFLVTGRKHRLLDKTPRNALRVPFVDALFPDANYIFLRRDGRENVNSLINAWRTPRYRTYELPDGHSIPGVDPRWWKFVLYPGWRADRNGPLEVVCAKQWVSSNDHALAASKEVGADRWVGIRYEDLVDDPIGEVGRILEFLGVPYEGVVRDRAAATATSPINIVTPPERGKWRRENPNEIAAVLDLMRPTMAALGYNVDED